MLFLLNSVFIFIRFCFIKNNSYQSIARQNFPDDFQNYKVTLHNCVYPLFDLTKKWKN